MRCIHRLAAGTALVALALSACSGAAGSGDPSGRAAGNGDRSSQGRDTAGRQCPDGTSLHGPDEPVANAPVDEEAQFPWRVDDPAILEGFPFEELISGGPPPDGIPAIDAPCFGPNEIGDEWLEPQSPVMVVENDGDARAYPLAIMTQHEIVNDVVGGEPLVVTYCPLCNSGLAFERTVDGEVLDFGTSGRLFQANLVMYDRQSKSLWVQFTGRAIAGERWVGTELQRLSTSLLAWEEYTAAFPDGRVLSRDTGFNRSYGRNPYTGYEDRGDSFLFRGPRDDRLPPNSRVVGLTGPDDRDPTAVTVAELREQRVVEIELAGEPVVVFWAPGQASALDASQVDGGRDVGQTGSFVARADGRELTFEPAADSEKRFVDQETGTTWNLVGEAVAGPLQGQQLEPVPRDDTFWFVWFGFRPETRVVGRAPSDGAGGVG